MFRRIQIRFESNFRLTPLPNLVISTITNNDSCPGALRRMKATRPHAAPPMFPRERANWFDTEGNLYVSPQTTPLNDSVASICVSQIDRTPLDAFARGAAEDGIASRIERKAYNGEGYRLTIDRVEDIAKELSLEMPFIRSRQKWREIRAYLAHLERPRAVKRDNILRAREIVSERNFSASAARGAMNPMDRANWHETEGCLSVSPGGLSSKSGAVLLVSQFEIEPLQDFVVGCAKDGITCEIYRRVVDTGVEYSVRTRRLNQIALELSLEIPYLRTSKTLNQIRAFADYIWLPRKRLSNSLEEARKVLARGPVV